MKIGLIKGRHKLPLDVTKYVWEEPIPKYHMADGKWLYETATKSIVALHPLIAEIYVTGFSPALLAVVRVCAERHIKLICWNYDSHTFSFWKQEVLR